MMYVIVTMKFALFSNLLLYAWVDGI